MLVQWLVDRFVQSKSAGPGWHRSSRSRDETAEKVGYTSLCLAVSSSEREKNLFDPG
jgi:hypothetical protein